MFETTHLTVFCFFVIFVDEIAPYILMLFNAAQDLSNVPESWKGGVIVVIQKNGDKTDPANQRPISLLNGDYKLFTKYLNKHFIQQHLEKCIPSSQLCSVNGRSIQDGLILI